MLDGVPLYDRGPALEDIWGTTTIDPHMIERAEVFRAAVTALARDAGIELEAMS